MPDITYGNIHTKKFFHLKKKKEGRFGEIAHWYNTCLTLMRPQVHSLELQKKAKRGWACTGVSSRLNELAQWLRILATLAKDQDLTARTHRVAHSYLQILSQGI